MNRTNQAAPRPAVAGLYLRVSSAEQVKSLSLDTQERVCRDFCERKGWPVEAVWREEGESAATADRTELQRALRALTARGNRISRLVVYDLSRFARSTEDHLALRGLLRQHGVELAAVTQPVDDSPEGRFFETVLAGVAQLDNELKARRVTEGMRDAVARGAWVWRAPLGYRNVRDAAGRPSLELDPERAPLIRAAFVELASGARTEPSLLELAHARGLRTREGKRLSQQTWWRLLRSPMYAGRVRHEAWGIDVRGAFQPLVDEVTWRRAQAVLAGKPPRREEPRLDEHPDFPLRRFCRCAACGGTLTGAWSRNAAGSRYGYYTCWRRGCRAVRARREVLEQRFVSFLGRMRPSPELLDSLARQAETVCRDRAQHDVTARDTLQREQDKLRARLERLDRLYVVEETIDADTYRRQRASASGALLDLDAQLAAQATNDPIDVAKLLSTAGSLLSTADRHWPTLTPPQQRLFEVALLPDGVDVTPPLELRTRGSRSIYSALELVGVRTTRVVPHEVDPFEQLRPALERLVAFQAQLAAAGVTLASHSG